MTPPPPAQGPLDNRVPTLLGVNISLTIFATTFACLRLGYTFRTRRKVTLSDYLLMAAIVMNLISNCFNYVTIANGQGRHSYDPYIALHPNRLTTYFRYLFLIQIANVWAMGFVKASICAYLMALNFSSSYRAVIWFSVIIVVSLNFITPTVSKFGYCRPISKAWLPKTEAKCWKPRTRLILSYLNVSANILTDLIYTAAPLVYIAQVKLKRRTKIGVCAVFLFGLCCSVVSIVKLLELTFLAQPGDPTYNSVDLTIYSISEVAIGLFAASLPPLRKPFDQLLNRILPDSFSGSSSRSNNFALRTIGSAKPNFENLGDEGSEKMILGPDRSVQDVSAGQIKNGEIYRSVQVTQSVERGDAVWETERKNPNQFSRVHL